MPKEINLSALAQAIDTTWGRSSTPVTASHSVKFNFHGSNRLLASYQVLANFVSEKEMILLKRGCSEESIGVIDAHVKFIKSAYKELTGDSISLKEVESTDSLEVVGFNVHNPKRTVYYRRKTIFELA